LGRGRRVFVFQAVRGSLDEVLADRDIASLGDVYVNFGLTCAVEQEGEAIGRSSEGKCACRDVWEGWAEVLIGFQDDETCACGRG
jgi:hypothetical protein